MRLVKAHTRITEFSVRNIVPATVLSGVYKLRHPRDAQERCLYAHDLKSPNRWIEETRSSKITQPDAVKVYLTTLDKVITQNLGLLSHAGTAVGY